LSSHHAHHLMHAARELHEAIDHEMRGKLGEELTEIIQMHAAIGAGGGLIPVPVVDIAVIIANTWTMYVRINKAAGLPFSENFAKSIATGIASNIVSIIPGIVLAKIGGALAKLFPGIGTVGGMAIDASVNYALMLVMGIIYLKALTLLIKGKKPVSEQSLRAAAKEATKDKQFVKDSFNEAKSSYKPGDEKPKGDASQETP
jgi:uncharacterized protein (DUF697 family)